jgi:hypothetical protein
MTGILAAGNQLIAVGEDHGQPAVWIAELNIS